LKYTRLHVSHLLFGSFDKKLKKGFSSAGVHGFRKGRTPSFSTVTVQGKLRNNEKAAPYVKERLIQLSIRTAFLRFENPQVRDLVYHPLDVTNGITLSDTQKDEEPPPNVPCDLIRNQNSSLAHPLDNRSHAPTPVVSE
jgi:hypothetical protein